VLIPRAEKSTLTLAGSTPMMPRMTTKHRVAKCARCGRRRRIVGQLGGRGFCGECVGNLQAAENKRKLDALEQRKEMEQPDQEKEDEPET